MVQRLSSQAGQATVIRAIFDAIGDGTRQFVEIGFNENGQCIGSGSNTCSLWRDDGWSGWLFDGAHSNASINLHRELVFSNSVVPMLRRHGVPVDVAYVSVDVDSTDLWLVDALLRVYRPRLLSSEFNPNFPWNYSITFPDHAQFEPAAVRVRAESRLQHDGVARHGCYYGASLRAFESVARVHGYEVVAAVWPLDVFMVPAEVAMTALQALANRSLAAYRIDSPQSQRLRRSGVQLNANTRVQQMTMAQAHEMLDWKVWKAHRSRLGRPTNTTTALAANAARQAALPQLRQLRASGRACFKRLN